MRKTHIIYILLVAALMLVLPATSSAQIAVGISVHIGPPILPVYAQPICPGAGYLWTPGYWSYGDAGYYWVPGVWVSPPRVGVLWTPGYWGFAGGAYGWHAGYGGVGFAGGEWRGGHFAYNTAVVNVNTTVVHNTFVDRTVVHENVGVSAHASFNGGPGGTTAVASVQERAAANEPHVQPTSEQVSHEHAASQDRSNFASTNDGKPANPAMSRVGERAENQQKRIGEGAENGTLKPGQTAHIENQEHNINQQTKADRQANGGKLTSAEK